MTSADRPILILGAGINGAALARELALSGASVCVVDVRDLAAGTTAYSSRLIHGGLRYLEYRELDLVRESLAERNRLLKAAPHLVKPLRFFVPVTNRLGGLWQSAARFLGRASRGKPKPRGLWLVRAGLWMYDAYAGAAGVSRHAVQRTTDADAVAVNAEKYRWLCSYGDAQIRYPERFVVELLEDARRLAERSDRTFELWTYHQAQWDGEEIVIRPNGESAPPGDAASPNDGADRRFRPAAIVNATGAWVDETLAALHVNGRQRVGGTKGSHFITFAPRLRERLAGRAVYAEAADGRPIFVLPFGRATLVGTTDDPNRQPPEDVVATDAELDYLRQAVNDIFGDLGLRADEIAMSYAGVRPLPYVGPQTPASITRRHVIEEHEGTRAPMFSLIGGKLTTCRSLAEETAAMVLARLGLHPSGTTRERPLPGGVEHPAEEAGVRLVQESLARQCGIELDAVQAVWELLGARTHEYLCGLAQEERLCVVGTSLPRGFVRRVIEREWVHSLDDLVERRLMLVFAPELQQNTLDELAKLLVESGRLARGMQEEAVAGTLRRLAAHFRRMLSEV